MTENATPRRLAAELARLTPRDKWLLRMLREHQTLTTEHITELSYQSAHRARKRLFLLYKRDVLDRWRHHVRPGSQSWRWTVGPIGAALLHAEAGKDIPRPATVRAATDRLAASTTEHLLGINTFFVRLFSFARTNPRYKLLSWLSERSATNAVQGIVRPDGYGIWRDHDARTPFWLEFDTGTERLRQLSEKLTGYGRLVGTQLNFALLFWFTSDNRESNAHRQLTAHTPAGLTIATASGENDRHPATDCWRIVGESHRRVRLSEISPTPMDDDLLLLANHKEVANNDRH
ncbi:replication-relaxation family protein [Fodinicola acaciae]|uniref:replication-relaxation family protein n=1 Tax=Fodinicola acaciae TaxID=2681555 RepID=UPI0013D74E49|nr:replication-relaxation family protein [Fodinicola acaciae]